MPGPSDGSRVKLLVRDSNFTLLPSDGGGGNELTSHPFLKGRNRESYYSLDQPLAGIKRSLHMISSRTASRFIC